MHTERFAPSPTGPLHIGHAYSAWLGFHRATEAGGRFLLRMEDLDHSRIRPEWEALILRDLEWLGLNWKAPVIRQSQRLEAYEAALDLLDAQGLLYRCDCTRRDIQDAISAPQEGMRSDMGPDGLVYPGTCRYKGLTGGSGLALRLDMAKAIDVLGGPKQLGCLFFDETGQGPAVEHGRISLQRDALIRTTGDLVLRRKDGIPAYHLAVVVDDAWQGVTHVTRGADLFTATPAQRILQGLLGLPTPVYHHHRLVRDEAGKRLAKRDDARSIASFRDAGLPPAEVLKLAGVTDPHPG